MTWSPDIRVTKKETYVGIQYLTTWENMVNWLSNLFGKKPAVPPPPAVIIRRLVKPARDGWGFDVYEEGDDLVMCGVRATCFGGSDDPQDSGETASGVSTKGRPNLIAVSLPMNYTGSNPRVAKALAGSPIPKMPFGLARDGKTAQIGGCFVSVATTDDLVKLGHMPVIDLGPAHGTGNAIDLTIAAAKLINPKATARNFEARVNVRIHGGTRYLPKPI